jgi:hypothetical protein
MSTNDSQQVAKLIDDQLLYIEIDGSAAYRL